MSDAVTTADYARAEGLLPSNADSLVRRVEPFVRNSFTRVTRQWIDAGPTFWYRIRAQFGFEFVYVDPERMERRPAFEHARLAAALSGKTGATFDPYRLPFETIEFVEGGQAVRFAIGHDGWRCDLRTYVCAPDSTAAPAPLDEALSPDGRWAVYVRDHNLWVRNVAAGGERRLTNDGIEQCAWGGISGTTQYVGRARFHKQGGPPPWSPDPKRFLTLAPRVLWSPDSKRILTYQLDERGVGRMHLVQSVNPEEPRPRLWSYAFPLPGDRTVPLAKLVIFELESGKRVDIVADAIEVLLYDPISLYHVWWSDDALTIYFLEFERGRRAFRLREANVTTGAARTLLEEGGDTHVEPCLNIIGRPNIRVVAKGRQIIWFSERDGWGHLYRYDGATGRLINRITSGAFVIQDILHVDEAAERIVLTARGREHGRDPYYRHAYSICFDGSQLKLLTPEDADHEVGVSPDGRFLVDTYSNLNLPPVMLVRSATGELLQRLEEADVSALRAANWRPPERICVKAADGRTDIYGTLYLPSNLDASGCYPVLDDIYPGPQINWAAVWFSAGSRQQALAELGFIVVTLDGRGTPLRSKAFHDYSYGNLQSAGALDDHIAGLRQLAEQRPYMDLKRVGIYGHSAGGYAAARALLLYPNFYRVAVSSAGNHDQRCNFAFWGESYQGLPDGDNYASQANASLAANLKGKLLLAYGELDENSHSSMTIQLVDALVKANKDFDLLIMPGMDHGFANHPYFIRRLWDYFVRHLRGEEPPQYEIHASPPV